MPVVCLGKVPVHKKSEREKKREENADKQSGSPYCTKTFQAQHKLPIGQVLVFADDMILGGRYTVTPLSCPMCCADNNPPPPHPQIYQETAAEGINLPAIPNSC